MGGDDAFKPDEPFFLRVNDGRLDGLIDLGGECPTGYHDLDEAVADGVEQAKEQEGECWIYECRPVRRIAYGRPVVRVLDQPKPKKR